MNTLKVKITGENTLLMNNPQAADRFNKYARRTKEINDKRTSRTDDDYRELYDLEMRAAIYWQEIMGVYAPSGWVMAALCKNSNAVAKISKEKIRGAVFPVQDKMKLTYAEMKKVKTPQDIVGNDAFRHMMILGNAGSRKAKAKLEFHKWSFEFDCEYDSKIVDGRSLIRILEHSAKYGGYGDFRPTFGRARVEVLEESEIGCA